MSVPYRAHPTSAWGRFQSPSRKPRPCSTVRGPPLRGGRAEESGAPRPKDTPTPSSAATPKPPCWPAVDLCGDRAAAGAPPGWKRGPGPGASPQPPTALPDPSLSQSRPPDLRSKHRFGGRLWGWTLRQCSQDPPLVPTNHSRFPCPHPPGPSSSAGSPLPEGQVDSLLSIISSQRERFRARNQELEAVSCVFLSQAPWPGDSGGIQVHKLHRD